MTIFASQNIMNSVRDYNSNFFKTMLLTQLSEVAAYYSHDTNNMTTSFNKRGGLGI